MTQTKETQNAIYSSFAGTLYHIMVFQEDGRYASANLFRRVHLRDPGYVCFSLLMAASARVRAAITGLTPGATATVQFYSGPNDTTPKTNPAPVVIATGSGSASLTVSVSQSGPSNCKLAKDGLSKQRFDLGGRPGWGNDYRGPDGIARQRRSAGDLLPWAGSGKYRNSQRDIQRDHYDLSWNRYTINSGRTGKLRRRSEARRVPST